ncbi:MAG: peroxidase-related enzyme [Rubricoccaceae bacterium]|nr:peroxidase-related enzyme [Rubricoccaceae bacterium]
MTWITTIPYAAADEHLLKLYNRIKGPSGNVDNIMLVHSLRPHTMEGHLALYKRVLHHSANTVTKWFLEAIGVYTSLLNNCEYCVEHHFAGMARLLDDSSRAESVRTALETDRLVGVFSPKECAALEYVRRLTKSPASLSRQNVDALRDAGWGDGEILEINQVVAYFAYANRTVLGLGVTTEGDILGLSPGDSSDPDSWQHT